MHTHRFAQKVIYRTRVGTYTFMYISMRMPIDLRPHLHLRLHLHLHTRPHGPANIHIQIIDMHMQIHAQYYLATDRQIPRQFIDPLHVHHLSVLGP